MTEKLLPCPFCGSQCTLETHTEHPKLGVRKWFSLGCKGDGCYIRYGHYVGDIDDLDLAIKKWNTRATQQPIDALARLQDMWDIYKNDMRPETRNDFLRECSKVFGGVPPEGR